MSTATLQDRAGTGAIYTTAVLCVTNLVGYLDRSILTLVVQPVKASLGLSDGAIGLMQGAAFILTFSLVGLLVGRLVDRVNRRNLLFVCVAIWSISAALGGLAQTGWQLFIARMGVGVGEAALIPAAVSLIGDNFAPSRRGKPYGLFTMGIYAGGGLSLILVSAILPRAFVWSSQLAAEGIHLEPWRLIMLLMLVPGVICCTLLATMREPSRTPASVEEIVGPTGLQDWMSRRKLFLPHHLAMALVTLAVLALGAWMPTALIRDEAVPARTAGLLFGSATAVTGILSTAVAGLLSDRAARRAGPAGPLRIALACTAAGIPGLALISLASGPVLLLIASMMVFSPLSMAIVAGIVALTELSPARSRGQISSIYFVFAGLIGTAGGPAIVGYASDLLGHTARLTTIIGMTGLVAVSSACLLAWLAVRRSPSEAKMS